MGSVIVAVSGGIDSAFALNETLRTRPGATVRPVYLHTGYRLSQREAAERVTGFFGLELEVIDVSESFRRDVVDASVHMARRALTPNPCALCNRSVKFGLLAALLAGDGRLVTGHYARLTREGEVERGADAARDQSYFLALVGREDLDKALFPLGGETRERVRAVVEELGLPCRPGSGSQDLCFSVAGECGESLRGPGPIVDTEGVELGIHRGLEFYTVGQRRHLGISTGSPVSVRELDADSNRLIVERLAAGIGPARTRAGCVLEKLNWLTHDPAAEGWFDALLQYRYGKPPVPVEVLLLERSSSAIVRFVEAQGVVAPGQIGALYVDRRLHGGGIISA